MQAQDRLNDIQSKQSRQASLFIGHGSPMVAIEFDDWNEQICNFIENNPRPTSIVVVSAHWQTQSGVHVTGSSFPPQIYDFDKDDYPETLFHLTYPVEGNPALAARIAQMLQDRDINTTLDEEAGLDHGTWVPLYVAFPNVDIPVVQISIPKDATPETMLEMGRSLSSLRKEGVMLIGSGNIVNNKHLSELDDKYAETDDWAMEFDSWFEEKLNEMDLDRLLEYEKHAPHIEKAVTNTSHLLPLFFVLGTLKQNDYFVNMFEGFHYGNISMRSFALIGNN